MKIFRTVAPYGCPPAKFPEFHHLHFKGVAKGCSIIKQVFESLRGDLFSADSPWELGCVGGRVCWIHEPRSQGSGASRRAP